MDEPIEVIVSPPGQQDEATLDAIGEMVRRLIAVSFGIPESVVEAGVEHMAGLSLAELRDALR